MKNCNPARLPFYTRVAGVPPGARLLQSSAFPQGEADGVALREFNRAAGCIVPGEPGTYAYINGHVRSAFAEVLPGVAFPFEPFNDEQSCAIPVKLSVERCGFPGETFIDSDSAIIVAAGQELDIRVYAPPTWLLLPTSTTIGEAFIFQFVEVRVTACPVHLGEHRPSRLTWFGVLADGDVILRPRRARTLQVLGPNVGGSQWELTNGDPTASGIDIGFINFAGGFVNAELDIGAASHLELMGGGGTGTPMQFSWGIE